MLKNKEQLLYYMAGGNIHLSNQDACFFQTLHGLIFRKKQITSNQAKLFNKLIVKYKAQLKRKGYIANDLLSLPWNTDIIESTPEYTQANLSLKEGIIYLRTPFNKLFIQEFNKTKVNPFTWDRVARNYQAPFSTYALKTAIAYTKKFYSTINFCPEIESLLQQVPDMGEGLIWKPTLIKTNSGYYVAASNSVLAEKLRNITLNDDPATLFQISQFGIDTHESITENDDLKKFASEYIYSVNLDQIETMTHWLKELNIKQVLMSKEIISSSDLGKEVKGIMHNAKIQPLPYQAPKELIKGSSIMMAMLLRSNLWKTYNTVPLSKIIIIKNSRPVTIR